MSACHTAAGGGLVGQSLSAVIFLCMHDLVQALLLKYSVMLVVFCKAYRYSEVHNFFSSPLMDFLSLFLKDVSFRLSSPDKFENCILCLVLC